MSDTAHTTAPSRAPRAEQADGGADAVALASWRSRSAVGVTTLLAIESVTGLVTYLGPFSVSAQLTVLVHTALGLCFIIPYTWFQVVHLRVWSGQRMTAVMALGYVLMALVITCIVSGAVLTYQAALGPGKDTTWALVHLVSGVAASFVLVAHLALAIARRRAKIERQPAFRAAALRLAGFVTLGIVGALALRALVPERWAGPPSELPIPAHYALPEFAQQFDEYRGSPFAPSYARTAGGTLVRSEALAGSTSCGTSGCHEEILAEWQPSAHRFAAMNPPFQAVQANFAAERGAPETRYCAGCHDPISLFAGAKDLHSQDLSAPGMQEGLSCIVCHSIAAVDTRGTGDYVLAPPRPYLWEGTTGWRKALSDFLIRAYPSQHLADYDRNILRTPEYCGACHKQFIPEALNRFGESPGQNQYDEWRNSHWHSDDVEQDLSCHDCHMRLVHHSGDPGRGERGDGRRAEDDGAHRHHGFIATNFLMPEVLKLEHWERHVALTQEWIRGETVIPEIAHLWPEGPVIALALEAPASVAPGEELVVRATASNAKAGHNFTTGPLDFMQAWIHLVVTDEAGNTVAEWGRVDPETGQLEDSPGRVHTLGNTRDDGTLVFEAMPLDAEGNMLRRHELWNKAGGEGLRVLFPRYSDTQTYSVAVPESFTGRLNVQGRLQYRKYRQEFLDLTVPDMERDAGFRQGLVTQSAATLSVRIAPDPPGAAPSDAPRATPSDEGEER